MVKVLEKLKEVIGGKEMENNIFDYATVKEFSQDIAITWLINCYKYTETKKIGQYFIEKFIFNEKEKVVNVIEVIPQYEKIDVYAEIETEKNIYSVIIENKKNTFLHDDQMRNYIERIIDKIINKTSNNNNGKTEKILFILFKSGNLAPYEELEYEEQRNWCQSHFEKLKEELKENQKEKKLKLENLTLEILNIKNIEEFQNALKKDTNNYILNLIIDAYNKEENTTKENTSWIYKKTKEEWASFIEKIKKELNNENIKFSFNSNVKGRGNYRTNFEVEDKEFLNISNKIMPNCKWGYCIDWGETTVVKFILNGPNGYKQYKKDNMTAEDRTFVEKRMNLINVLKDKLKDQKDNLKVGKKSITTFSIVFAHITSENMSSENVINKMIFMKEKVESALKEYCKEKR